MAVWACWLDVIIEKTAQLRHGQKEGLTHEHSAVYFHKATTPENAINIKLGTGRNRIAAPRQVS